MVEENKTVGSLWLTTVNLSSLGGGDWEDGGSGPAR
jgi:hypothetical protein